ncbi:MAG TPA: DHH family phosphoesterase [Bacilli bacterium]|nr:DHH family phosphoesterase [Bacilli bacterium]
MINYNKIIKRIKKSENVFVMGHKAIDFDAFGACLAISELCERLNKKCYIIIEDPKLEEGTKKGLEYINENNNKFNIGKYSDYKDKIKKDTLLIIVDTYSSKRAQSSKLVNLTSNIIYIDHHLFGEPVNDNYFIDSKVSSTCEILTNLFIEKKMRINKYTATVMLTGINIDSNNFSVKTNEKTHKAAAYLHHCGADLSTANNFSKTKLVDYIKIQKIIFKTKFYKKKFAIVVGNQESIYERKNLAIISDTLLLFDGVVASFAIGYIGKKIAGISARGNDYNVQKIMKKFGGGGSKTNAACQIENITLKEAYEMIKGELK